MNKKFTINEIAKFLDAKLARGDGNAEITSIAPLTLAKAGHISFLEKAGLRKELAATEASVVMVRADDISFANQTSALLVVKDPYVAFAKLTGLFVSYPKVVAGIHSSALVGENCNIDKTASVGANCVLGDNVTLGAKVVISAGSVIGDEVVIDDETRIWSNVIIYYGVKIGKRCIMHSGTVIGADGFGMANDNGRWQKIFQLGGVVIGDDVELGANVCIDRGALQNTIIEDGVKLDNQVNIAHNVLVGAHTVMAGCSAVAGSSKIGKHCMFGGDVGIADHVEIADGVILTARSGVAQSITEPGIYASGIPATPAKNWWRIVKRLFTLDDLAKRLSKLEEKVYDNSK